MPYYPNRDLTHVEIKDGYPNLAQNLGGILTDGIGNSIDNLSSSFTTTASYSVTASFSPTASYALSSSFVGTSSYALTSTATTIFTSSTYPITSSWATTAGSIPVILTTPNTTYYFYLSIGTVGYQSTYLDTRFVYISTTNQISGSSLGITASLFGTASWAANTNATTLNTASTYPITSSWANNSVTSSFITLAQSASYTLTTASLVPITSSNAVNSITASQGSKAWGNIFCINSTTNFTSSTYGCSVSHVSVGNWSVLFSIPAASNMYSVNINAFSGSSASPTASYGFATSQTTNGFTMSFVNITSPTINADFATASFTVNSY